MIQILVLFLSTIRIIPHLILLKTHHNREVIKYDIYRWTILNHINDHNIMGFIKIMTFLPEYRNLFYARIGKYSWLISWLCPKMNTLYINTKDIGPGLYIQHGFASIIIAKSIGKDCWINQQVTIGHSDKDDCPPTLGDNVIVNAGAKIIGKVHIGNNSKIGANAVVVKDVPENCTVVGVPAYIVRRNGKKVLHKCAEKVC